MPRLLLAFVLLLGSTMPLLSDEPKADPGAVSFMKDVAPILVQNCIGCHNPRKAESKYSMTTFALLAKGGQQGEDVTLEAGDPDASRFVELLKPDAKPRMPYKLDVLPAEKIALIERWVKEGAKYDGLDAKEDWVALLHKITPVVVPEAYPVAVPITALAFSPDGTTVAASGYHEVNLWKLADATLARRLRGVAERVHEIAYSPDGKWLATASGDPGQYGSAKLWLAEPDGGGKPVRDLFEGGDAVFAVAFSPDSKTVAAAGADRAIRLWEVESGKLLSTIEDHADWVLDVAFSPDGTRLASASRDKTSKVFDVAKRESLVTFPGHAETVFGVAFAPDGKTVATCGGDAKVRLWKPDEEGKQAREIGGFGGPVFKVAFTADGKALVACSADKTARLVNPADGATLRNLAGHADYVYTFALSADGKTVATGGWDGEIRLWNFDDGKAGAVILAAPGLKPPAPIRPPPGRAPCGQAGRS